MIESKSNQLDLSAIPSSGIEPLLNYAYSGNLKLSLRTIGDVLATSSFLQVLHKGIFPSKLWKKI